LALGLAAQLLATHGIEALRGRGPQFLGFMRRAMDETHLYERVLEHLPRGPVQRLAKPGLVLRRVSPRIIREVLAGPCKLGQLDEATARELFDQLAPQITLVDRESGDVLRHRQDVRVLMLPGLEQSVGSETVAQLDRAAVDFYAAQDG